MRRPIALVAAILLCVAVTAPVEAATVQRAFGARVGRSGTNGTVRIAAYTSGYGRIDYALKGLRKRATYRVEVRKGRCSNLGAVVARPKSVRSSSRGTVSLGRGLSFSSTQKTMAANRSSLLAIRFVSGSSIRCGNLSFTRVTRIQIPTQGILGSGVNLAVVRSPNGYPYCNVGMYMGALSQPTEPGVSYVLAHARKGMFLPLLDQWRAASKGARMIGMSVCVYTSNSRVHRYVIDTVRTTKNLDGVFGVPGERLWLQTSTGPNTSYPKLILEGSRVSSDVTTYAASHPRAKIVRCN
jgi:hypothetical protein